MGGPTCQTRAGDPVKFYWRPQDREPTDVSVWREALRSSLLIGFVTLEWEEDGWRVVEAFDRFGTGPSGTVGKGADITEEVRRAFLEHGL